MDFLFRPAYHKGMMKNTNNKLKAALCFALAVMVIHPIFASNSEKKTSVELSLSVGWTFGGYKETTFSNLSQSLLCPRFQLDAKITSGNFLHIITADYFFDSPKSAMTTTAVVYQDYDPVSGENYYQGSVSNLSFHRIRLEYDLLYKVWKNEKFDCRVGGNFSCNAFLQFENYPSITGLFSIGPSANLQYKINERNSLRLNASIPLLGYGIRPPYAGCDALLMKYAEDDFMKIFTLGNFLSVHNYQSVLLDFEYKLKASDLFSLGLGCDFEYARIAVPEGRPLYLVDGNFKTFASVSF